MNDPRTYEIEIGGKTLTIQHGILAQQANGAVTVRLGDTVVLVTVCMADAREGVDFFPLTVDYEERLYAVGKIPGGFPRREGRASTEAILAMRLTDRPLRPLFPKGFRNEVQVIATTLSADREHQPDTLITIGASAALGISDIPFNGPVSSVRVTRLDGEYIVNPTFDETERGDLDIVVAGTKDAVVMVEAGAKQVSEDVVLEAIEVAMEANRKIIALQEQIAADVAPVKKPYTPAKENEEAVAVISEYLKDRIPELVATAASERSDANKAVRQELQEQFGDRFSSADIADALWNIIKKAMRKQILEQGIRADGRGIKEIRPLDIHVGVLPRTHGSGLFQRGQTQVLTIATLGGLSMVQKLDTLSPDEYKRYMHHYNFPPYSVGEVRPLRGAGRREIGHGALAERALEPVIPSEEEFPYALRLVSEVMSSNGSTSMASVCGSTLALMDAGVPIAAPVAGIAMGLIMGEDGNYRVLTDIAGQEDFMGDMDFKVAGTAAGITALQMDIKIGGVSRELLATALQQAREAREYILQRMLDVIPAPRPELSPHAPKMYKLKIPQDMIGTLIGPGGKTVRRIQDEAGGATIDIQEDGTVIVGSPNEEVARKAIRMIEGLTKEVQVGEIYTGKVTRLLNFGAFVEILPGKEGLVHISQLGADHVRNVEDEVQVGDEVTVMVSEIDNLGRINLSRRAVLLGESPEQAAAAAREGSRDRGPRGGSGGGPGRPSDRGDRDRDRGGRPGGGGPQRSSQPQPSRPAPSTPGPVGGATRGWVRRSPGPEGAPPPPRRDFGGGMDDD
ncbi:polyribonucleotide nucleotidyltransferase [Tepidiforma sp.]|uniref:polyribonucleotide nucleotidyltransferase n=1 Tax=Tepidiforma sp. TaxID=2682230 RepID=UPI002624A096|nr:polyribonucleotide nucleotidyltransferase [Tepidiforma sp.]MCX7616761.1 polyribonucleotide nucleotidyltransferase [Tepidiforma sp.]